MEKRPTHILMYAVGLFALISGIAYVAAGDLAFLPIVLLVLVGFAALLYQGLARNAAPPGSRGWRLAQSFLFAAIGLMGVGAGVLPNGPFLPLRLLSLVAGAAALFVAMKALQAAKQGN